MATSTHRWTFFRAGGVDQVRLDTGADLLALRQLDPKLWVTLSCPTTSVDFDRRTLHFLDTEADGRIRAGELLAAVDWLEPLLKDPDDLVRGKAEVELSSLRDDTPQGKRLLEAARSALSSLGKKDATRLSLPEATAALEAFRQMPLNGDGRVHPGSTADLGLKQLIEEVQAVQGAKPDAGGSPSLDAEMVEAHFASVGEYLEWVREPESKPELRPLEAATSLAAALLAELEPKVDDYFARCQVAAFDPRSGSALNRDEKEYATLALKDLSADLREMIGFPLARIESGRPLPLTAGVNPAWAPRLAAFRTEVVQPLLGDREALTHQEWATLAARLRPHRDWQSRKKGGAVEKLGRQKLEQHATGDSRQRLLELIAQDKALEPVAASLASVEKLLYLHRDLHTFCNNFVSFHDFYRQRRKAIFQAGTLYLDQRSTELCIRVENAGAHASMAGLSRIFLVYCDCVRKASDEKLSIAAAITAGDSDNLMVGRNGLFVDNQGKEWDATVTRLVDQPISVRQAFWAPYKKVVRFIEEQIAARAGTAEAESHGRVTGTVTELAEAGAGKPPAPAKKLAFDVGVVAALGVAVGGITAALGALLQAFFGLGFWMPLGFIALVLAISGPSMVLAWLKLRQRNLGPLLDANGWAINTRAKINIPFGGALTRSAELPAGAGRDLSDPFAEKARPWKLYVVLALVALGSVLWLLGKLDPWLPDRLQASRAFGWPTEAPAVPEPTR